MKEEIFDFDKHKGRKIKALVNYPMGGRVKKGEIGILKHGNIADFPSQSGYACGVSDNFYKKFELLPEDAVKEPQFEVGKWYKFDWVGFDEKVILKIDGVSPTSVLTHNRVFVNMNDVNINAHDDGYFVKDMQNIELLTDLSEIQQYLPNNHPDKIKKELAVSDLVEDEIYHITYNKGEEFIILSAGKSEIKKYIRVHLRDFHNTGNCYGCKKIRPATPEEKKLLKVCIKQDKFIEQSALDLYDDEGNIKVIEQKPSKDLILGKFNIGDIVVSLTNVSGRRLVNDIFKVLRYSTKSHLYYTDINCCNDADDFRLATPEEIKFYKQRGKNINDMKSKLITIPKYWYIENKYQEVRDYLADTYSIPDIEYWRQSYIGFDNSYYNKGCHGVCDAKMMQNGAVEITIEQFNQYFGKKESVSKTEEFILPEKWCIKVTAENKKSLGDWRPMKSIISTGSYMLNDNFKGDAKSKGYVTPYYDKNYTEITFEQFKKYVLKETVTKDDLLKQEPMKTAVHVKTSEEFDFVISKIREKSDRYNSWNVYRTESCISSDFGDYQNKDWFSKNNYKVVSFEDWCEDNEYIFVTQELKEGELKVGDYAVVLEGYCGLTFNPGNIVKLVLDEEDGFQCLCVRAPYSKNTHFIYTKNLRKATTQEILAETLPTAIVHIKNPFEITNAQENINILPKPKELEIVPISKYFKIRN